MGTKKTISSLKRENLMEMHKVLTNPANASIIVVGDISVDEASRSLIESFKIGIVMKTRLTLIFQRCPLRRTAGFICSTNQMQSNHIS